MWAYALPWNLKKKPGLSSLLQSNFTKIFKLTPSSPTKSPEATL